MNTPEAATQYFNEGKELLAEGKLEEAIAAFRQSIELNPGISWYHHHLGEALAKMGQLDDAIAAYRRAIELNPDFSWSYHHLADALAQQLQPEEAAATFRKAVALNPQHFGSYWGLGESLAKLGQLDEAIAAYRQAKNLNPEMDWIHHKLGEVLEQRTKLDLEGAIASYRHAVQLNPNDVQSYRNLLNLQPDNLEVYLDLGNALAKQGNWREATETYQKAIEFNSQEALIHNLLGEALEQIGDLEAAVVSYRRAIDLHPFFMSDEQLGKALAKLSYLEQFPPDDAAFLQKTSLLSDAEFVLELFRLYLKRSLNEEEVASFLEVIRSSGRTRHQTLAEIIRPSMEFQSRYKQFFSLSFEEVHWQLGTFFAQKGEWYKALVSFHQAVLLKPEIALAYSRWAEHIALENKYDEQVAIRAKFFSALLNKSYSAEFYACLGKLLARIGRVDEALEAYKNSLLLIPQPNLPEFAEVYINIGQLLQQKNRLDEAIKYYKESISLNPNKGEAYINIGHILSVQNQLYAAIKFYKKAVDVQPNATNTYIYIGHILSRVDQIDEAIKYYTKALQQPDIHYHAYLGLANCLTQKGNLNEAVSCLQGLIKQGIPSDHPEALRNLGNILLQQGKIDEANACFQKAEPVTPPQGFYPSTREWAVKSNSESSNYIDIHPSHQIQIPLPKTLDEDVHPGLKNWSKFESPATFAAIVQEGRYCQLDGRQTAYITADNQILLDVSSFINPGNLSELSLPSIHEVNGTVAVLSGNTSAIYYHWIIDALPKLGLIELSGIELDSIDKFVVRNYKSDFHKETLNILGIPENKIIDGSKYPHVKADRLVLSSYPGIICCPTKWTTDFLRSKFLSAAAKSKLEKPERIYISRRIVGNRRIINEAEVIEVLDKLGFVTITAESISIAEKISLMSSAKVIVTQHSGGGTNLLFCNPGTKVIEIFTPNNVGMCYYIMSHHLGLEYYYLIGDGIPCTYLRHLVYEIDGFEDTIIDVTALSAMLNMAGVK
ncbi:tetratricopeptide repeat protein [Kamptonema sp. UHCC 0994]|uniref:tetratricopeptide repeat protein n=1 Tax=Kamptonema sp. UHCC 0994 TaxID=3031329 RepID=UPI0023B93697|nr:tetratricopeptide repeat protein [Kamptonema sp. UHCC 0994]MDF0552045.1 tetratricopeptide repeat protein [Kamptonema sp. UHCC 0994]